MLRTIAAVAPWLPLSGRTARSEGANRASDNEEVLSAQLADPTVLKESRADAVAGLMGLMSEALAAAPHFDRPALVLYGEKDRIVPPGPVARLLADLPSEHGNDQRFALYPYGYHMLMRDLEAALVIDDLVAWTADPTAPLPSGADRDARARLARIAGKAS